MASARRLAAFFTDSLACRDTRGGAAQGGTGARGGRARSRAHHGPACFHVDGASLSCPSPPAFSPSPLCRFPSAACALYPSCNWLCDYCSRVAFTPDAGPVLTPFPTACIPPSPAALPMSTEKDADYDYLFKSECACARV